MEKLAMEEPYVCTLDEAALKTAQDELFEDPKERQGQIDTFRAWVKQQKHITAPTDTAFLLKFLRKGKFSQLRARECLENFLKAKTKHAEWLDDIDIHDPTVRKFLTIGSNVSLPKRDQNNRRIMMNIPGRADPSKKIMEKHEFLRAMFGMAFVNLHDERDIIHGMIMLEDLGGLTTKHMTQFGIDTMKKMTKIWQDCFPGRPKAFHYYKVGPVFETIMPLLRPFIKKKFLDRMNMHGKNLESVYKAIPMEYLPSDYLPDDYKGPSQGSIQDVIDGLQEKIKSEELRERVLYETSSKWKYDFSLKPDDQTNESFRQLSV